MVVALVVGTIIFSVLHYELAEAAQTISQADLAAADVARRISMEEARREALEARISDLSRQIGAVQTVALGSIATLELVSKKHIETV